MDTSPIKNNVCWTQGVLCIEVPLYIHHVHPCTPKRDRNLRVVLSKVIGEKIQVCSTLNNIFTVCSPARVVIVVLGTHTSYMQLSTLDNQPTEGGTYIYTLLFVLLVHTALCIASASVPSKCVVLYISSAFTQYTISETLQSSKWHCMYTVRGACYKNVFDCES